MKNAFIVIIIS